MAVHRGLSYVSCITLLSIVYLFERAAGVELTFELPDKEEHCFYEEVKEGVQFMLEFQVVEGGKTDVDCKIQDPKQRVLYEVKRKSYDTYQTVTKVGGEYKICFSNQFSTFTHKVVYFDLQVGEDNPSDQLFPDQEPKSTAFKQTEQSTVNIYERLRSIIDYQTHHRLKEVGERHFAEGLRDRVQLWSALQFVIMMTVSVVQVLIVRSFFNSQRKAAQRT